MSNVSFIVNHFYREELNKLTHFQTLSFEQHSKLSLVCGRGGVGKTLIALSSVKSCKIPTIYFYPKEKTEQELCAFLQKQIETNLNIIIEEHFISIPELLVFLLEVGKNIAFNLILDDIQILTQVNSTFIPQLLSWWKVNKFKSNINLIVITNPISINEHLNNNSNKCIQILNSADNILHIKELTITNLRSIISIKRPNYINEDLITLYGLSQGLMKYVIILSSTTDLSKSSMLNWIISMDYRYFSFVENTLLKEFNCHFDIIFKIIELIYFKFNQLSDLKEILRNNDIGHYIKYLIEDVSFIKKNISYKSENDTFELAIYDNLLTSWQTYNNFTSLHVSNQTSSLLNDSQFDIFYYTQNELTFLTNWYYNKINTQQSFICVCRHLLNGIGIISAIAQDNIIWLFIIGVSQKKDNSEYHMFIKNLLKNTPLRYTVVKIYLNMDKM